MPFEYAVRPFQSNDPHGRIIIPSAPAGLDQRATLTWGAKTTVNPSEQPGKGIVVTTHWPDNEGCTETTEQLGNEMATVQVMNANPDAPGESRNQTVTFHQAYSLTAKKEHKVSGLQVAQINASPASVLKNYETEAAQMGVRTPETEKCKVQAELVNAV
jgi:hypothetical protein